MAQLSIIANVNARRNRSVSALREAAPSATFYETRTPEELRLAVDAIARDPPRVLGIAGGDGTVTHTLTALYDRSRSLPPIALLGGGAYDSLAPLGGKGSAARRLRRLTLALAANELRSDERDTLRVEGRCGFRFGVGMPVRFIEALYQAGGMGAFASLRQLVRAGASSLAGGAFAETLYAPIDLRVRLDGEEWPRVPIFGLVAASVAEAGLGLRPFRRATEQPGAFQALGLTARPRQFALELPRILFGKPTRRDRLIEGVGEKLELFSPRPLPYLLDGEIYTPSQRSLEIAAGPRVTLVRA